MWVWRELHCMMSTFSTDDLTKILRQNCFEVFDLPLQYKVDSDTLNSRYQELQKQLHPDKFINHPDSSLSIRISAHINDAYNTLNSPLLKAIALLEQNGIILDLNVDKQLPATVLMEQMELYEEIEDANHDIDQLNTLAAKLAENISKLSDKIGLDFESKGMDSRLRGNDSTHGNDSAHKNDSTHGNDSTHKNDSTLGNDSTRGNDRGSIQSVIPVQTGIHALKNDSYSVIIEDIKKLAFYNKIAQQIDEKIEESW